MTKLIENADLTHEDARGWYDSYGWHITTENEGDVTIDAVEYDWLDGTDAEAIANLRETYDALTDDEAESIVVKAREVREAGEAVEGLLDEAVEAYQRGDMEAVVKFLGEAARVESEHGDSPAANSLRSQLLGEDEESRLSIEARWSERRGVYEWHAHFDGKDWSDLMGEGVTTLISEDGDNWTDQLGRAPAGRFDEAEIILVGGPRDGERVG